MGTISDEAGLELKVRCVALLLFAPYLLTLFPQGNSPFNFGLGPGVVPEDGSGPAAQESKVTWMDNATLRADMRNIYGEPVPVDCADITIQGQNNTCDPADLYR